MTLLFNKRNLQWFCYITIVLNLQHYNILEVTLSNNVKILSNLCRLPIVACVSHIRRIKIPTAFKCGAMCSLVPFVQFENVKNTHGEVLLTVKSATLLKVTLLHGRFSRFLNCTMIPPAQNITYTLYFFMVY